MKMLGWTNNKISAETRWLQIFQELKGKGRLINNLSLLVQFAFSIPGSSTEVERLFSIINDVWGPDKPQMNTETLEAFLNIKFNSDMECTQYYESIKNDKQLLSQVHSNAKYGADTSSKPCTSMQVEDLPEETEYDSNEEYYEDLFHEY